MVVNNEQWYIKAADGIVYGPAQADELISGARDGRIDASCSLSKNQIDWLPATSLPALELQWACEVEGGQLVGPLHRDYITELIQQKSLPSNVRLYRLSDPKDEAATSALSSELEKLKSQAAELKVAFAAEQGNGKKIAAALQTAQATTLAEQEKVRKLTDELTAVQKALSAANNELASARKTNDEASAQIVKLKQAFATADTRASDLTKQLAAAKTESDERRQTLAATEAEKNRLSEQLAAERARGRKLADELKQAQAATTAEQDKQRKLAAKLADAEEKIRELKKAKKSRNPLQAIFGSSSTIDLAALEKAAQREFSAMKRPRPRPPVKGADDDVIDVGFRLI